jgi:peptidoglycan/xylan/chitin deacetylase (PgdA/CDA1 family)
LAGRLDQRGSLGAEELGALAAAGMEIGTHGWNHVPWPGLDAASFRHEVSEARARLADVVGRPVTKAALPLGQYDRRVLQGLRDAAYESVSTSDRALARSGSWLLPRFSVHATDSVASMRATVTAAIHPWSRVTSSAKQAVKRLR